MLTLTSSAFVDHGAIPKEYTCDGQDIAPPLAWRDAPAGTRSFALIVDDPDAPDPKAPRMTWVHWVLYDIPPATTGLPKGMTARDLPPGTREGVNDWRRAGYGGLSAPRAASVLPQALRARHGARRPRGDHQGTP